MNVNTTSEHPARVKWSIRWQLMGIMAILAVSLVIILTSAQIASQHKVLEDELRKRTTLMRENLVERGKNFIVTLARQVENAFASANFSGGEEILREEVGNVEEIKYAILVESSGKVKLHTLKPELEQSILSSVSDRKALGQKKLTVIEAFYDGAEAVIEIVYPIKFSTEPWGVLRLIYTTQLLEKEIARSEKQIAQEIQRMIYKSVGTAVIFLGFGFLLVFFLSTRFSRPLIQLTQSARSLSKGNFSISADLPTRSKDEVGVLAATFSEMSKELKDLYANLEQKVAQRTEELADANKKILNSIQYAKTIQRSLLPDPEEVKTYLPRHFFLWMPRDIIGGDMFFTDRVEDSFILAVMDCTGHGVPGAFMTMLASSALQRIIHDEGCHDPAEILKRLNFAVKTLLKQDTEHALSDDGLEAAICFVKPQAQRLIFAGAQLSLYYVCNHVVKVVKGDSQNIGYKRSDMHFTFANQTVEIKPDMAFYLSTDGFIDQLGGLPRRRFGIMRFMELLQTYNCEPFEHQREFFLRALNEYKGDQRSSDDIAVVGFSIQC